MKAKIFLLIVLATIGFFTACKKDNIPDEYSGTATAKLNGIPWEAHVRATGNVPAYGNDIGLDIQTFDEKGYKETSLSFEKVPLGLNSYQLAGANWYFDEGSIGANYFTLEPGGDVNSDTYDLDTLATTNYFEVLHYDSITHDIEVRFDATFYIDPRYVKEDPNAPDTIHITEGRVSARVHFF